MGKKKENRYKTFTKNKSKWFQGIAGPKTVVEGFPARRGLSGLPANRMTAKKPPGTWALALWTTKTLTTTCQQSKNKGNGQHKVTGSCISLHFSFMISMQEIPRTSSQWSTPCAFEELRVVWAQGKERLRAPCWNCQRSTNLPTTTREHKRHVGRYWADPACEARELGLKKNISKWSLWRLGWKVCAGARPWWWYGGTTWYWWSIASFTCHIQPKEVHSELWCAQGLA